MKINTAERSVQRSNTFQETTFRINGSAQAFDILSSKIYKEPILAIVRELSTNAADAHIEAGTQDKPFDVQLPNSMDPCFRIRDYGTGLSQEDVETIYTTYFQSTRNESDDFTGALGLGSKTPFAYTDMFLVTSYHNGMAFTYSVFKNESGAPSIALMSEEVTDAPNGLEIKIDVKPNDAYLFHDAAQRVYPWFKVKPNVTGHRIDIEKPEVVLSGDGWELHTEGSTKIRAVMGNVAYEASRAANSYGLGHSARLTIYVDMGSCSIAASREELHLDDRTKACVQEKVTKAIEEARSQVDELLSSHTILLEKVLARKKYEQLVITASTDDYDLPLSEEDKFSMVSADLNMRGNRLSIGNPRWEASMRAYSGRTYHFLENDVSDGELTQKYKNRIRYWLENNADIRNGHTYVCVIQDKKRFAELYGDCCERLSQLPDKPRVYNGGSNQPGPRSFVKLLERPHARRQNEKWLTVVDDQPDTTDAIAIPRQGFKPLWNGNPDDTSYIKEIAALLGYETVYGIASKHYDKIRDQLGLEDLYEVASKKIKTMIAAMTQHERARYHHSWNYRHFPSALLSNIKGLSKACNDLLAMSEAGDQGHTFGILVSRFGMTVPSAPDFQEKFKQRYPLLASVNFDYADPEDVTNYIKLIEKK